MLNQGLICSVYSLFICSNVQVVVDDYMATHYKRTMDKSFYLMMLTVCLILMTMIRTIKTHANIALIGNCLTLFSVSIIFARSFRQWEMTSDAQFVAEPIHYPIFFGVAMFVLDSVSNVSSFINGTNSETYQYM